MSKEIITPRAAAQQAAKAALALFRSGMKAQAKAIWTASMESFK
jgi:hypothetical protein